MKYATLKGMFYEEKKLYEKTYEKRFNSDSTYKFKFSTNENDVFVVILPQMLTKIERILKLNDDLNKVVQNIPGIAIQQFELDCLKNEIIITNEIEGVVSTKREIEEVLKISEKKGKKNRIYGLVKKYVTLEEDIDLIESKNIRELYDKLVYDEVCKEDAENKPDGNLFRKKDVFVRNAHDKIIHTGVKTESQIIYKMDKALKILNNEDYSFFVRVAVFHYLFGYIHPFYDGNGRVNRFISSKILSQRLNKLVCYNLSNTVKKNLGSYYKIFKETNYKENKGELTNFVLKFLDILIESIDFLVENMNEKRNKLNFYEQIIKEIEIDLKGKEILFILVQNTIFGDNEGMSIEELVKTSDNIKETKIRKVIKEIENKGLLITKKDGRKKTYNINSDNLLQKQ